MKFIFEKSMGRVSVAVGAGMGAELVGLEMVGGLEGDSGRDARTDWAEWFTFAPLMGRVRKKN
jgi:hypothetical protein